MNIRIYDCPTFSTSDNPKRGSLVYVISFDMFICFSDFVYVNGNNHAVFKRVYNIDEEQCELWVKGEVKNNQ